MLDRVVVGSVPRKHHIVHRDAQGALLHEECFTREGFDGPYTILYHQHRPHAQRASETGHGWEVPSVESPRPLAKRHYRALDVTPSATATAPIDARVPLFFNRDVVVSISQPSAEDPVYFANADADELVYVFRGGGVLRSAMGDVPFDPGDYVMVPRGVVHRWIPDQDVEQRWLSMECLGWLALPKQWRNAVGQLRMDAPFCHRDFRRPTFEGPHDEGIRELVVKRGGRFHGLRYETPPLDAVGWDGSVYPWAFPILCFQPRAGLVHLPPTWHGTFAIRGGLVCSFVPRVTDFHPEAIPCPYPHSSTDCDEILFYCDGNFTSRRGVGPGSISHHPAGLPHGPHPGAYEGSIGSRETNELAVMLDTYASLSATDAAIEVEDAGYMSSFAP